MLLKERLLAAADERTVIVVNSGRSVADFARTLPGYRVIPIDAIGISLRCGLCRIVNSALLGALARGIGAPSLPVLETTLTERSPKLHDENIAACEDGYRSVDAQFQAAVAT